jgi:suppressor for copper-sensitivity B
MKSLKIVKYIYLIIFIFLSIASEIYASDINSTMEINKSIINLKINLLDNEITYFKQPGKFAFAPIVEITKENNLRNYEIIWPEPKIVSKNENLNAIYDVSPVIKIITFPKDDTKPISFNLKFTYSICSKMGCFLKEIDQIISIDEFVEKSIVNQPQIVSNKLENGKLIIEVILDSNKDFLIAEDESGNPLEIISKKTNNTITEYVFNSLNTNITKFKLSFSSGNLLIEPQIIKTKIITQTIFIYLIMAFIGGFILNLMPCVLPVLSLKLYNIANSRNQYLAKEDALISLITIILYFQSLSLITIFFRLAGKFFISGFSLQSSFVILFILFMLTLMLSITLDKVVFDFGSISNFKISNSGRRLKTAVYTLISTILATPCTAPFLASSMSFAMTQSEIVITLIFFFSSLGFAAPYILIIFFPRVVEFLPKSGNWQLLLKKIMVIMIFASILWLLYVIKSQLGLFSTITAFCILYLLKYAFEVRSGFKIKILAITVLCFSLIYIPVKTSENYASLTEKKLKIKEFSYSALENHLLNNDIIIVNVTADWCVTCKYNSLFVLNINKTKDLFKRYNVILLEADITNHNEEANRFLKENNALGVPFTIIYRKNRQTITVLPVLYSYLDLEKAIID